jgi:hypothetical protein
VLKHHGDVLTRRGGMLPSPNFFNGYFVSRDGAGNMYAEGKLTGDFSGTWFAHDSGTHL